MNSLEWQSLIQRDCIGHPPVGAALLLQRPQEVTKSPVGNMPPLAQRGGVSKAKVNAHVDASIDHVTCGVRQAAIPSGDCRAGTRTDQAEAELVAAKNVFKHRGRCACQVDGPRGVIRVIGGRKQRRPSRISNRLGIAVVVAHPDGSDRAPEIPGDLAVPGSKDGVGHRDVDKREHAGAVAEVHRTGSIEVPEQSVPVVGWSIGVEARNVGLVMGARAVV